MKIRRLLALGASVALLTTALAVPASAATPPTVKIGQRGVEYAVEAFATNCPQLAPNFTAKFKAAVKARQKLTGRP